MGCKNIKEHFNIVHHVHLTPKGVCIGSAYIPDIIVIGLNGVIMKFDKDTRNADLIRYQREIAADPRKAKDLFDAPDTFSASIPVFCYDGGVIIEKRCENLDWPNVTHDGVLMYDNMFFADKKKAVSAAKVDAAAGLKWAQDDLAAAEVRLAECRTALAKSETEVAKLAADYPA